MPREGKCRLPGSVPLLGQHHHPDVTAVCQDYERLVRLQPAEAQELCLFQLISGTGKGSGTDDKKIKDTDDGGTS